jgi:hypothetical protein
VVDIPDPDKPENWVFQLMPTWPGKIPSGQTDAERLSILKKFAEDFAEPWKSTFLWIPDGTPAPGSDLAFWETIPWDNHNGTVTLAGDSAHAMPPRKTDHRRSMFICG